MPRKCKGADLSRFTRNYRRTRRRKLEKRIHEIQKQEEQKEQQEDQEDQEEQEVLERAKEGRNRYNQSLNSTTTKNLFGGQPLSLSDMKNRCWPIDGPKWCRETCRMLSSTREKSTYADYPKPSYALKYLKAHLYERTNGGSPVENLKVELRSTSEEGKEGEEESQESNKEVAVLEHSTEEGENENRTVAEVEKSEAIYPAKPLLRVRNLLGDRLSRPKESTEEHEVVAIEEESNSLDTPADSTMFTIENVRSLNSESELESSEIDIESVCSTGKIKRDKSQKTVLKQSDCIFQCAYCFYRAVTQTYVEIHQKIVHGELLKEQPRLIYKCRPLSRPPAAASALENHGRRQSARPYQCDQCGAKFFITKEFMNRLTTEHQSVIAYTCHICKNLCFNADRLIVDGVSRDTASLGLSAIVTELRINTDSQATANVSPLIKELASIGNKTTENLTVKNLLPNAQFSSEIENWPESCSVLISSGLSSTSDQNEEKEINIPLEQLPLEAVNVQRREVSPTPTNIGSPDKNLKLNEIIVNLHSKEKGFMQLSNAEEERVAESATPNPSSAVHKLPPIVLSRSSCTKVYPPNQTKTMNEKSDDDPKVGESEKDDPEKNKKYKEELSGKDLYVCGNNNCNFSAENNYLLKEHMYVCDLSRETFVLVCPHCSKQMKYINRYLEHVKYHGEKKFHCGLCSFSSAVDMGALRHVKKKHKCSSVKFLPKEGSKEGHSVCYPKNYKVEKSDSEMNSYSPGDEDKLPLQSVYQVNVKCAKCPYFTKVRSNMVRHLKIHVKSVDTESVVVVPSTAPTNPVPCLEKKERMFDKMTNLAASSQMAQAKEKTALLTLTPEEEAKLPQFVAEQMRYKCCLPDCNYITIDDGMLKHHIKALHDEINYYSCPHCRSTVHVDIRHVTLDKIGHHLKHHDSRLYKCAHCIYFHYQKTVVEKHVVEKHPDRRYYVYTVREPKPEATSEEEHSSSEGGGTMWKCGLCSDFACSSKAGVMEHLGKSHNTKSKYKCRLCFMKSNTYQAFFGHFASKHAGEKIQYVRTILKVNSGEVVESPSGNSSGADSSNEHFDTTPLWQRGAPRVRHIRGILIDEEEVKTKKSKRTSVENETLFKL